MTKTPYSWQADVFGSWELWRSIMRERHMSENNHPHTFSAAIALCKRGKRIRRAGWNGEGQFVFYVPATTCFLDEVSDHFRPEWLIELAKAKGNELRFPGKFGIKTPNDELQVGWLASQADMSADDWIVFD
jgi:hypothetical protein